MLCVILSCSHLHHNDVSLTINESEHYYKIYAHYATNKTIMVEKCMDKYLRKSGDASFINTRIDGDITLNNGTTFYIKNNSGELAIKLNKDVNTADALDDMKALAKGLSPAMK